MDKVLTKNGAFRDAKRRAGIPNSTQHKKPVDVYDGTTENRRVYEFDVDGKKKYIIEHREDKFGRGPHFHGADDLKGTHWKKEDIISILDIPRKILLIIKRRIDHEKGV
ncbi:HNH/endonuclease VII fold putative polymorphic toxin [Cytobacillus purgationiresistens]|uniref:HNH/endonuclease VII fold putative polymorphic toxin n=1 Tax=Cytobacillus purgationiresistens TaxID=863449 RepID=UPI0027D89883|nr:HNH/endonuclease VII fold putative polymorphic toxin [Cytobacillus purgationiresistens]